MQVMLDGRELKNKLRTEMREKIELRADLIKAEVEIDRLNQSNTMLLAKIEEARTGAGLARSEMRRHDEVNRDDTIVNDPNNDAMEVDVGGLNLKDVHTTMVMCNNCFTHMYWDNVR